jgi:hypothetical protein
MPVPQNDENGAVVEKLDLIVRLLAAIYTKGANKTEAITKLAEVSLSNMQIAEIVGVSGGHVRQVLYMKNKSVGNTTKARKTNGKAETVSDETEALNS